MLNQTNNHFFGPFVTADPVLSAYLQVHFVHRRANLDTQLLAADVLFGCDYQGRAAGKHLVQFGPCANH